MVCDLHALKQLLVGDLLLIVEHGEDHHLKGANSDLISLGAIVTDLGSQLCATLVKFPVELSPSELGEVVLLKNRHALLDLVWESVDLHNSSLIIHVIFRLLDPALVWPVSSSENLAIEIDGDHLMTCRLLELLHSLL